MFRAQPAQLNGVQPSATLSSWMDDMEDQQVAYGLDTALGHAEKQLDEFIATAPLSQPVPQRTAFACDLLQKVSAHVGRHSSTMRPIARELLESIYRGNDNLPFCGHLRRPLPRVSLLSVSSP
jgi:hypothetical protein